MGINYLQISRKEDFKGHVFQEMGLEGHEMAFAAVEGEARHPVARPVLQEGVVAAHLIVVLVRHGGLKSTIY